jgi:shikimate dehydrogenase
LKNTPGRLILLGQPVSQSLSPLFQNAALRHAGLHAHYDVLNVSADALERTLRALADEGAAGNVTIPHKERVAALCDVLSPLASRLGAVNTWWSEGGVLHGDNTDVGGFDDAIVALLGKIPIGARVALLGAGGSARAVAAAVSAWPKSSLAVWARNPASAATVVALGPASQSTAEESMAEALRHADLVVNATPIGMRDNNIPVNPDVLRAGATCFDLVYRRDGSPTPFVALARAQGRRADNGLTMLIAQGARSWQRWFGIAPDQSVMIRVISDVARPA